MKGMELSRKYFDEYGLPMLKQKFPQYIDKMAAGLAVCLIGAGALASSLTVAQNALDLTMNTRRITISEQASVYGCPMIFTGASALRYKKSMTDFLKHIWA